MPAINLNHVSVCAVNLDDSVRFYEDLFGMERLPTPNFGFPTQWMRVGPLEFHLFERPGSAPAYHHLALSVDDFNSIYRRAKEMGILDSETFGYHLYELPGNNAQMYLRDPGGNLIEIDWPDISNLAPDVRADMRKLADKNPQGPENLRATLFLTEPVGRTL